MSRFFVDRLLLVFCSFATFISPAHAFLDPPVPEPNPAVEGQAVMIRIHGGVCDALFDQANETDISVQGNVITIIIDGDHADDPIFCTFGPAGDYRYSIGAFAPGDYTIHAVHRYPDIVSQPIEVAIGSANFTVIAAARPIPAIGTMAGLVLALLIVATQRHAEMN